MKNPSLHFKILWTDESRFTNNGLYNRHNFHHLVPTTRNGQNLKKELVLMFGPIVSHDTLNGPHYLELLQNRIEDMLDDVPLAELNTLI